MEWVINLMANYVTQGSCSHGGIIIRRFDVGINSNVWFHVIQGG